MNPDQPRAGPERSIEELIEASSLGTPEAKALRSRTPREVVDRIMERVNEQTRSVQYQDCGMVGSLRVWSCLDCGALVTSRGTHDEWHYPVKDRPDVTAVEEVLAADPEDKVTDLMAALERSVQQAREARDEHRSTVEMTCRFCKSLKGIELSEGCVANDIGGGKTGPHEWEPK